MKKHRAYFKEHSVMCLIYTDDELNDLKKLFSDDIAPLLAAERMRVQLSFEIMEEFFDA